MNNRGSKVVANGSSVFFDYDIDYKIKEVMGTDATAIVKVYAGNILEYFKDANIVNGKILVRLTTGDNYNLINKLVTIKIYVVNAVTGMSSQVSSERYSFSY